MLIAEDLLVLLVPERTKGRSRFAGTSAVLAAAVLIDLAGRGRLDVDDDGWLVVVDQEPTGRPVLDDALRRLAEVDPDKDKTVEDMIATIVGGIQVRVLDSLTERGYLAKVSGRHWELRERSYRQELCIRLRQTLVDGAEPDERGATVIYLLSVMHVVRHVITQPSRDLAVARAEEYANGDHGWATNRVTLAILEAGDDWVPIGEGAPAAGIVGAVGDLIAGTGAV